MTATARAQLDVAAPPARVWRALTDPAALAAWYWPPRFATEVRLDARVGGAFRIASPVVGMAAMGRVLEVQEPELLALTWRWEGEDLETEVGIVLTAVAGGTRVVVEHRGLPTETAADEHAQGWSDCLGRLPGYLASGSPALSDAD